MRLNVWRSPVTGYASRVWLPVAVLGTLAIAFSAAIPAQAGGGLAAIDAFHVGRHHLAIGEREQALESFNDALRLNPQFVQAYLARGKLLAEMGQYPSALADLNFALQLQPTHAEGYAYRGFALVSMGRPKEAIAEFDVALRLDSSYARVHYLRGQTLQIIGDEAGAEVSLAAALQLDPTIEASKVVLATTNEEINLGPAQPLGPAALERTSVMSSSIVPPPAKLSARMQGNVVRFDRHPSLGTIAAPAVSQPLRRPDAERSPATRRVETYSNSRPMMPDAHASLQGRDVAVPRNSMPRGSLPHMGAVEHTIISDPISLGAETVFGPELQDLGTAEGSVIADEPATASDIMSRALPTELSMNQGAASARTDERLLSAIDAAKRAVSERNGDGVVIVEDDASGESSFDLSSRSTVAPANPTTLAATTVMPPLSVAAPFATPLISDEQTNPADVLSASEDEPVAAVGTAAVDSAAVVAVESNVAASDVAESEVVVIESDAVPLDELDTLVRARPADARARFSRALRLLEEGDNVGAIADFDEALKNDPAMVDAYYGRGRAKQLVGRTADAVDDFSTAVALDDQHAFALIHRGHCFSQLGKFAAAKQDRENALALDPSLAKTGPKYETSPEPTATVSTEPKQTTPAPAPAASAYGNLFATSPNATSPSSTAMTPPVPAAATVEAEAFYISDEGDETSATVQAVADDGAGADREVRQASAELERTPGDAKLYVRRATAFCSLGRLEDAAADVNAALRLDPQSREAKILRAVIETAKQ